MIRAGLAMPRKSGRQSSLLAVALTVALAAASGSSCATDAGRRQAVAWTEIGNAWAELEKWDKAGDAWSRAMALDPGQAVAGYNLSRALAEAGKYDQSIAMSDTYLATDPDNAAVLSVKAYALHKAGRNGEAIAVYERVVSLNGADSASLFNLAVLYESAGRQADALSRYDDILKIKPDDAPASYRKGLILADRGLADEALPYIVRYAEANPDSTDAARSLAVVQEAAGRFADAMDGYMAIVAKDEKNAVAWFELARLRLTVAGDEAGGLVALGKAIASGWKDTARAKDLLASNALVAGDKVRELLAAVGLAGESTTPVAPVVTPASSTP
jgi:tetratricopeptide (TPR) repeat protein